MRRILAALHRPEDAVTLLRLAARLASTPAQIEACFISDVANAGGDEAREAMPGAAAVRAAFDGWSATVQAGEEAGAIERTWREIPDGVVYAGASLGRASDLIVTRAAEADRDARGFRDALLASGRLTLLAPSATVDVPALLDHLVVAWDGSAAAAHALAQALPLLSRAKSVRVVIVGRNTLGERAREAIGSYVTLHHPGARLLVRDHAHRQTGRALLDALREERASLVVMGASGRSDRAAGAGGAMAALGGTILKIIEDGRIPILAAV